MTAPAPIDRSLLERCLAPFPEEARTLPAVAYISDDVFAWERSHLFEASWFCLGRSSQLATPGDQRAVAVGGDGVLLVRGEDGRLRGFFNTCRHRGHELLPRGGAPTNERVVRCPYHRWMYDLEGAFRGGPGLAAQLGFDGDDPDHSLIAASIEEWHGWVFVNVSGAAATLAEHVGTVDELLAEREPHTMFVGDSHTYELRANWKLIIENYHECYHCTEIHPELCSISSPGSGEDYEPTGTVVGGSMTLFPHAETMSLDGKSLGVRFPNLSGRALREVYYLELFPNLLLSVHPDYVMTHRLEPIAPGLTSVECAWLFPPEAQERADFDPSYAVDFWDVTNRQDWAACESVQRGMAGRGFRQSQFSDQERCVHKAMAMVARGYLEGSVEPLRSTADARGGTIDPFVR